MRQYKTFGSQNQTTVRINPLLLKIQGIQPPSSTSSLVNMTRKEQIHETVSPDTNFQNMIQTTSIPTSSHSLALLFNDQMDCYTDVDISNLTQVDNDLSSTQFEIMVNAFR